MHFCEYVCHEMGYFDYESQSVNSKFSYIYNLYIELFKNSIKVVINTLVIMAFDRYCTVVRSKTANFLKRCKQKPSFILLVSIKEDYLCGHKRSLEFNCGQFR